MNGQDVSQAVRKFNERVVRVARVVRPAIPRVTLKFGALYRQCAQSQTVKRGAIAMRRQWPDAAPITLGRVMGRAMARARGAEDGVLVVCDGDLTDAILFEPALRSLAEKFKDARLRLWTGERACEIYRAAPYLAGLTALPEIGRADLRGIGNRIRLGYRLGRGRFETVVHLAQRSGSASMWVARTAQCEAMWLGDAALAGEAQNNRHPAVSILESDGSGLLKYAGMARAWEADLTEDAPRIYCSDRSLQLAYGRARSWRSEAARLGAQSLVALAPWSDGGAMALGMGAWASTVRELWSAERALCVLVGGDEAGAAQLSSLLNEVPHLLLEAQVEALELAALVGKVDAVMAVENGVACMAMAQRVPTMLIPSAEQRTGGWPGALMSLLRPDASKLRLAPGDAAAALRKLKRGEKKQRKVG